MNETVTISRFAKALAAQTAYKEDFCEQFVAEIFRTAEEVLKEESSVKIKGIGEFKLTDEHRVIFLPDQALADSVNEPFSCFEPEELDDDITEEILNGKTEETDHYRPDDATTTSATETSNEEAAEENDSQHNEPVPTCHNQDEAIIQDPATDENDKQPETDLQTGGTTEQVPAYFVEPSQCGSLKEYEDNETNEYPKRARKPVIIAAISGLIIGIVAGAAFGIFLYPGLSATHAGTVTKPSDVSSVTEEKGNEPATVINTVQEKAQTDTEDENTTGRQTPETVTETVSSTNYLATMSRRHYGRYEFWVYIYEENRSKLGHPDKIAPNTVVIIPPAEKYDIRPNDPESVRRALEKSEEIYSSYTK